MKRRERDYLDLLRARCDILRMRVDAGRGQGGYVLEWSRELKALEWAINMIELHNAAKGEQ